MDAKFPYTPVHGRLRGLFRAATLWSGTDHFLSVRNARFTETYHRYYYADIQALAIRKTPRLVIPVPWLFLLLVLLTAASSFTIAHIPLAVTASWLLLLATLIWLAIDCIFLSCACHIQTAVSRDPLPSLYRLRTARRAIAQMALVVEQQQGPMDSEWTSSTQALPTFAPPTSAPVPASTRHLWVAFLAFFFMLVSAGLAYIRLQPGVSRAITVSGTLFSAPAVITLVIALVLFRSGSLLRTLRITIIVCLIFVTTLTYARYMFTTMGAAIAGATAANGNQPFKMPSPRPLNYIDLAGNTVFAFSGIIIAFTTRRKITEHHKWQA